MSHIINYSSTTIITSKDVMLLLKNTSERTAQRVYNDIKKEYDLKIVLFCHFKKYLKID